MISLQYLSKSYCIKAEYACRKSRRLFNYVGNSSKKQDRTKCKARIKGLGLDNKHNKGYIKDNQKEETKVRNNKNKTIVCDRNWIT